MTPCVTISNQGWTGGCSIGDVCNPIHALKSFPEDAQFCSMVIFRYWETFWMDASPNSAAPHEVPPIKWEYLSGQLVPHISHCKLKASVWRMIPSQRKSIIITIDIQSASPTPHQDLFLHVLCKAQAASLATDARWHLQFPPMVFIKLLSLASINLVK